MWSGNFSALEQGIIAGVSEAYVLMLSPCHYFKAWLFIKRFADNYATLSSAGDSSPFQCNLWSTNLFLFAVLFFYDYILTLPMVLRYIWNGKANLMKILFIMNRYARLLCLIFTILLYFVQPVTNSVRT